MKIKKIALVVYEIVFFFPILASAYDLKEYYPLNQGNTWKYLVTEDQKSHEDVVKIEGWKTVGNLEAQKIVHSNEDYGCLTFDSEGLKQHRYFDKYGYEVFVPPEIVLPDGIRAGETKEYLMDKIVYNPTGEKIDEKKESRKISLESIEDVKVLAGEFKNCLKFSIISEGKDISGNYYNEDDCTVWLAQNVGEVKSFCIEKEYNPETRRKDTFIEVRELISAIINGKNIGSQELPTK